MRLLLDESVPVHLREHLPEHKVSTNGALLALAAPSFDALITVDKNLRHQQNLACLPVAVVVLSARSNRLQALVPLIGRLRNVLSALAPRSLVVVSE